MCDEELITWLSLVIQKVNDRPLILGAPLGITLTPNHILHGFRNTHGDEINLEISVQCQLTTWQICLLTFRSLWIQEFTFCNFLIVWKEQGQSPNLGDIFLFRNELCYKHQLSTARIINLLK